MSNARGAIWSAFAAAALFACVAVPFGALAVLAWRGSPLTPRAAVTAGLTKQPGEFTDPV